MILGDLIHQLADDATLARRGASWRMNVEVTGITLFDALSAELPEPGAVVVAVGTTPDHADRLFAVADQCSASCVVLGYYPDGDADPDGVPVLCRLPDTSWDEFYLLLSAAVSRPSGASVTGASDLFELADVLALAAGAPAIIEDQQANVLAYSSIPGQPVDPLRQDCINNRHVPRTDISERGYQQVARSLVPVRFPDTEYRYGRAAMAIRSGGHCLGSVWVADIDGKLSETAIELMPEIASMAAFHILREQSWRRHASASDIELADQLLRGVVATDAQERWERSCACMVVAAITSSKSDPTAALAWATRAASALTTYLAAYRLHHAVAVEESRVYLVLGMRAEGSDAQTRVAAAVSHLSATLRTEASGAIGRPVTVVEEIPTSRREADEAPSPCAVVVTICRRS